MGKVLVQAAMVEGKHVTFLPSYGPEMRGGTANCSLVIADEEIASPVITTYDILVVMNQPSYDKFVPHIAENGCLFVNTSLVEDIQPLAPSITCIGHTFTDDAGAIGDVRLCNFVAVGRIVKETEIVAFSTVVTQMKELTAKRPELYESNIAALEKGFGASTPSL